MNVRAVALPVALLCFLTLIAALSPAVGDAYTLDLGGRLLPPRPGQPLGTDELGRDLWSRLVLGSRYTLGTAVLTSGLAGASGWLLRFGARAGPRWFAHLTTALAHLCFVLPGLLLAPRWPNRLLMAILCAVGLLPLFGVALVAAALWDWTGWTTSLALGPLLGIGVAHAARCRVPADGVVPGRFAVAVASAFAWALLLHAVLDALGLGAPPPAPSWGGVLTAKSATWWPQVAAGLALTATGGAAPAAADAGAASRG